MRLRVELPEPISLPYEGREATFRAPDGFIDFEVNGDLSSRVLGESDEKTNKEDWIWSPDMTVNFFRLLLSRGVHIRVMSMALAIVLACAGVALAPPHMADADDGSSMAQPFCPAGQMDQSDMAGTYVSQDMRVDITPCGSSLVTWLNDYGIHRAEYGGTQRLEGNGIIALLYSDQPYGLDNRRAVWYKPAERGFIQLVTTDSMATDIRVYRLQKVGDY